MKSHVSVEESYHPDPASGKRFCRNPDLRKWGGGRWPKGDSLSLGCPDVLTHNLASPSAPEGSWDLSILKRKQGCAHLAILGLDRSQELSLHAPLSLRVKVIFLGYWGWVRKGQPAIMGENVCSDP